MLFRRQSQVSLWILASLAYRLSSKSQGCTKKLCLKNKTKWKMLYQTVVSFRLFLRNTKLFLTRAVLIHLLPNSVGRGSLFPTYLPALAIGCVFDNHSCWSKWYLIVVLNYITPSILEHSLTISFDRLYVFLEKSIQVFCPLLSRVLAFYWPPLFSLYIIAVNLLTHTHFPQLWVTLYSVSDSSLTISMSWSIFSMLCSLIVHVLHWAQWSFFGSLW